MRHTPTALKARMRTTMIVSSCVVTLCLNLLPLASAAAAATDDKEAFHIQRLQELLETRSFFEQQWRIRRAYPYLERGTRLAGEGRISEAIEEYRKYLAADPDHYLIHWRRLILLSSAATPEEVITAATEFLHYLPGFGPTYLIRGLALQRAGRTAEAQQDFSAALEDDKLVRDDAILALNELRNIAHKQDDHQQALHYADRLLEMAPNSLQFQEYRAVTLERLNREAEAAALWAEIAAQTRDASQRRRALVTQATLLDKLDQSPQALEILLAMRDQMPASHVRDSERIAYYRTLGSVADKTDEIEHAIGAYERVLVEVQSAVTASNRAQRDTARLRLRLAELYGDQQQPAQILRVLTPVAQRQAYQHAGGDAEKYAEVLYALAEAARQLNRVKEADAYWRRALRERDDWRKRLDFAYWLTNRGQLDRGLAVLDQGTVPTVASERSRYLAVVAELAEKAGQLKRALNALTAALSVDDDRLYREQYVYLLLRAGQRGRALPEMQRLADSAADADSRRRWHSARGDLAFELGRPHIALAAYEQALAIAPSVSAANDRYRGQMPVTSLRLAQNLYREPVQPIKSAPFPDARAAAMRLQLAPALYRSQPRMRPESNRSAAHRRRAPSLRLRLAHFLSRGPRQPDDRAGHAPSANTTPRTRTHDGHLIVGASRPTADDWAATRLRLTSMLHRPQPRVLPQPVQATVHGRRAPAARLRLAPFLSPAPGTNSTPRAHAQNGGALVNVSPPTGNDWAAMRLQLTSVLNRPRPAVRVVPEPTRSMASKVSPTSPQSSSTAPHAHRVTTAYLRLRLAELYGEQQQPAQIIRVLTPVAQRRAYQRAGGDLEQYADVLYALAEAARQLDRAGDTEAYWRRALRARDDWRKRLDFAYWLAGHARLDDALAVLDQGTLPASVRERGRYLAVVAELAEKGGQLERALQALGAALAVEENLEMRLRAAETAWRLDRFDETEGYLTPVVYSTTYADRADMIALHDRLCATFEKRQLYRDALECVEDLLVRLPEQLEPRARAAELARLSELPEREFAYLKELDQLDPTPKFAVQIGYLHIKLGQEKEAQPWFRKAYQSGRSAEGGLAYAHLLLKQGRTGIAIEVLSDIVDDDTLTIEQSIQAHAALGYALAETKDFVGAAKAWKEVVANDSAPVFALREAWALHRAGDIAAASERLAKIDVTQLPSEEQLTWHDEAGTLSYRTSDFEGSLGARRKAVALAATAERWFRVAETLIALERLQEADDALDRAIRMAPNSPYYAAQRGYLNTELDNHRRAADLFEQVVALDEDYLGVAEDLGYTYLRLFENDKAIEAFHRAIDQAQYTPVASDEERREVKDEVYRMRRQTDALKRRWQFEFFDSVCLIEDGCQVGFPAVGEPFSVPFGTVSLAYQPPKIGYRDGRVLKLFGRLLWTNEARSLSIDDDSVQAGVGVRYKPLKKRNLWVSMERLIEVGDDSEYNWLARLSWSHSQGIEWQPLLDDETRPASSVEYVNLYADVGKLLSRDKELFLVGEARYGRTFQFGNQWLMSPFAYLLGNGTFDDDEDDYWVEAGGGVSVRLQFGFDRYRGYQWGTELLLRVGRDIDNSAGEEENRALIGLRLTF